MHLESKPLRRLASPYLLLTLASLFWAGNWWSGGRCATTSRRWRWASGAGSLRLLILLPFAAPELKRNWHVVRANWVTLTLLAPWAQRGSTP